MVYNNFLSEEEITQIGLIYPTWEQGKTNEPTDLRIVDTFNITHTFDWLDNKVLSFIQNINKNYGYDISSINS